MAEAPALEYVLDADLVGVALVDVADPSRFFAEFVESVGDDQFELSLPARLSRS
ncbi:MAG: hypothetical protein JKY37_29995 [Nannocystaceae bacterium]|nr:hypothetical protein [Nannocystaceae bacterium]